MAKRKGRGAETRGPGSGSRAEARPGTCPDARGADAPGADGRARRPRDASLQGLLVMFLGAAIVWQADALGSHFSADPRLVAAAGLFISASGLVIQRRGRR